MANYTDAPLAGLAREEKGSPIEIYGDDGVRATVTLRTEWADRHTVLADIIDNFRSYPNLRGTGNSPLAFATTGTVRPFDQGKVLEVASGQQSVKYEQALLTINYTPIESNDAGGGGLNLFTESFEPNAEMLTLDPGTVGNTATAPGPQVGLNWGSLGDRVSKKEAPAKLLISVDYVQTRYRLDSIPIEAINLVGKVNDADVTASLLGLTFPAETLLYNPPSLSRQINSTGAGKWTMITRFSYRPDGWNRFWRAKTNTFSRMYTTAGTPFDVYELGDFSGVQI